MQRATKNAHTEARPYDAITQSLRQVIDTVSLPPRQQARRTVPWTMRLPIAQLSG